jgi:hypothetical protein
VTPALLPGELINSSNAGVDADRKMLETLASVNADKIVSEGILPPKDA